MPRILLPFSSSVAGGVLLIGLGIALVALRLGNPLARLSYDLPFVAMKGAATEAVVVYLDDDSERTITDELAQAGRSIEFHPLWPRSLHTELLRRLTRDEARLVYYDILFYGESVDPAEDAEFAAAIRENGRVVLSGEYEKREEAGVLHEEVVGPLPLLKDSARGWGLATFLPADPDYAVRRLVIGMTEPLPATWRAAEILDAPITRQAGNLSQVHWINYYGPPGTTIGAVSFHQARHADGVPPGFFKDKVVCIGRKTRSTQPIFGQDLFGNPYSRWGDPFLPGLEVHATILLNLIRGDWLDRLPLGLELVLVILCGLGATVAATTLRPKAAMLTLLLGSVLVAAASSLLHWYGHLWWNWLVPSAVIFPLGVIWAASSRAFEYASERRKREQIMRAFSLYLSPEMAEQVAGENVDLRPGGRLVEATVLFTDCKGFTAISEELNDAHKISQTLIAYFTETSRHVLENHGTIIKYIGDSVFACWNAPINEPEHASKAARAAWAMHQSSKQIVLGRSLTTRVGVCTGKVLAGNLGSPYRFDYTCIGDTVNFASRLEGLNKYLGTNVLISDSTRRELGDDFIVRALGSFTVAGKTQPVAIHELIAPLSDGNNSAVDWLQTWELGMKALRAGAFADFQKLLREVVWQRGGTDGPSEFYLKHIARLEKEGQLPEWTGIVKFTEK